MNENGNTNMESFEENTEVNSQEVLETSEESSSVSSGEGDLSGDSGSSAGAESSGADSGEILEEGTDGEGILVEPVDGVSDLESGENEELIETSDMVAVVEQLEDQNVLLEEQNVLLESQVVFLSMIIFVLMFNVCDRFISRIWSSIRSLGGGK